MRIATGTYAVRAFQDVVELSRLEAASMALDLPEPYAISLKVEPSEIDAFGHVNNTVYQRWMEACAWAHSSAVGLDPDQCRSLNRGMALKSVGIDYLKPSFEDQEIWVLNWITKADRLRAERRFQVICRQSGSVLARSHASYVCIDLATGAPARMPPAFVAGYRVSPKVQGVMQGLASR